VSKSIKVLVVDDSRFAQRMLTVALQNTCAADWVFEYAATGLEAIKVLNHYEPGFDLVVTDVNMPELSGVGLLRYIRKDPRLNALPVIVVSSVGSGMALPDLARKGASVVLAKPITTPESMARLAEVIGELLE